MAIMVINIKRKIGSLFPKTVMIEPWAIDIELLEHDNLKLIIHGIEDEIWFDCTDDNGVVIFSPKIYRVDIHLNGVDVSNQYHFR